MKERISSTISIFRPEETEPVATIPITRESRRVFRLMEEDSITLCFSLPTAVRFQIGDYCDDELFGRFVMTEEQMPAYNTRTGGFDYAMKLEALYMALKNKVHTLPATATSESNTLIRKETRWTLTDTLLSHAKAVIDNARLANVDCFATNDSTAFPETSGYPILLTAETRDEVRCINYEGISILAAIKRIAEAFETEWWVSGGILCFGKCEGGNEAYRFTLGKNVERMDIQNDMQDYCNSLFVFGGTENVPGTYRRSLTFKVTEEREVTATRTGANVMAYVDGTKKVTLGMLHDDCVEEDSEPPTSPDKVTCICQLEYEGTVYDVRFNPSLADYGEQEYYMFAFVDTEPEGFGLGSEYRLLFHGELCDGAVVEHGLEVTEVPLSWWARDYDDPSSLLSVGENRLMLPVTLPAGTAGTAFPLGVMERYDIEGSRITKKGLEAAQTVERNVVFDDVYPQCVLVVTAVATAYKRTSEEEADGSRVAWQWQEHTIRCKTLTGADFVFRRSYVKEGETLRMRFLGDTDLQKALARSGIDLEDYLSDFAPNGLQLKLAGMTFETAFNGSTQQYTLVRNDDYGCRLPNETLRPSVGDAFVLEGWDVRAMSALGLVEEAENTLLTKAVEYLDAMDEGQFVFKCEMMSEWMFHTEDRHIDLMVTNRDGPVSEPDNMEVFHDSDSMPVRVRHVMPIPFIISEGVPLLTDGRLFQVHNDHYLFLLPIEGTRVTVVHSALKDGQKTSRVIGYEFKLDKPYDTPLYTIGETEAYSRLRRLEKALQNPE